MTGGDSTAKRFFFIFCIVLFLCLIGYSVFLPLYTSSHVIINYGITPFDICIEQPVLWHYCKYWFIFTYIFASFFVANFAFHLFCKIPFPILKISQKGITAKKEKPTYSFIEQPSTLPKLELLIRRNRKR